MPPAAQCPAGSSPAPTSFLACVRYGLLRADPRLAPLAHVDELFTQLLNPTVAIPLSAAAASGSVRLLDHVAVRIQNDSDVAPAQKSFWFARAMCAALERDDLAMVQRIHAFHPVPLSVNELLTPPSKRGSTLGLSLKFGTLETVQWIVENRCDGLCCSPGIQNLCRGCLTRVLPSIGERDTFRIIMWLLDSGVLGEIDSRVVNKLSQAMQHSMELVQWIAARGLLDEQTMLSLLSRLIHHGYEPNALHLLDLFPLSGISSFALQVTDVSFERCLITAACRGFDRVVDKLIDGGWCDAFKHEFVWAAASSSGTNKILQWHREVMERRLDEENTISTIHREIASSYGDLVTLQWLYGQRGLGPALEILERDLNDQTLLLKIYQWMTTVGMECPSSSMEAAAAKGFLDVVEWLHRHSPHGPSKRAIDHAASNGYLGVIKWLHANRQPGCTVRAMVGAAKNGHLEVMQWLVANHMDRPSLPALQFAASLGQLDAVVWLSKNSDFSACQRCLLRHVLRQGRTRPASLDVLHWISTQPHHQCPNCDESLVPLACAVRGAISAGDLKLLEHLSACHRQEIQVENPSFTLKYVAQRGHLAVLEWIYDTFRPNHDSGMVDLVLQRWAADWLAAKAVAREFGHGRIVSWIERLTSEETDEL